MKKLLLTLLSITTIGAVSPAFAGPDWQLIEQARKAKHDQPTQAATSKCHSVDMKRVDSHRK